MCLVNRFNRSEEKKKRNKKAESVDCFLFVSIFPRPDCLVFLMRTGGDACDEKKVFLPTSHGSLVVAG